MTQIAATPVSTTRFGWRAWVAVLAWLPSSIASLTIPATLLVFLLWLIPAPEQGDVLALLSGHSSYQDSAQGAEAPAVVLIAGVTLALSLAISFGYARFGRLDSRDGILFLWLTAYTAPMRWWHRLVSRFATIPVAVIGGLLVIMWIISALITTASRDGWDSWLFLWMFGPLMLAIAALGSGLFSRWGANQYGSYLMAFGSIWMLVLLPVVGAWAAAGVFLALLPISPVALLLFTLFGDFGFASVVEGIPLDSPWAPLALQPFPALWLLGLTLALLYWLPATVSWLTNGSTAVRDEGRSARTVALDVMRVVYTFPFGPR